MLARQYREAARLSNEEKELQNQLEKHKDVVNNLEEELGLENNSVSQLNNEFSRIKEERMTKEKEEGDVLLYYILHQFFVRY